MFHVINNVLNAEELEAIHSELLAFQFDDGKITAGWIARSVKKNSQATHFDQTSFATTIRSNLMKHEEFRLSAAPLRSSALMLSKYEAGMEYGWHSDDPMMESGRIRTDLAFTLFLSDPASYDGGELEISLSNDRNEGGQARYKLPAGSILVYPAIFRHRVLPVVSGQRLVCVGWVQSMIRDHQKREIIRELTVAREALFLKEGKSAAFDGMCNALSNLVRMWAEN